MRIAVPTAHIELPRSKKRGKLARLFLLIFGLEERVCQFEVAPGIVLIRRLKGQHYLRQRIHVPAQEFAIDPQASPILWKLHNSLTFRVWASPFRLCAFRTCSHSFWVHLYSTWSWMPEPAALVDSLSDNFSTRLITSVSCLETSRRAKLQMDKVRSETPLISSEFKPPEEPAPTHDLGR